jgi:hypothetical protein
MWTWISAIVILFGAQLNSEIEHQTARDSTVRGEKPLGARGAVMADTVGKAAVNADCFCAKLASAPRCYHKRGLGIVAQPSCDLPGVHSSHLPTADMRPNPST